MALYPSRDIGAALDGLRVVNVLLHKLFFMTVAKTTLWPEVQCLHKQNYMRMLVTDSSYIQMECIRDMLSFSSFLQNKSQPGLSRKSR
jgi:hypothetical protein